MIHRLLCSYRTEAITLCGFMPSRSTAGDHHTAAKFVVLLNYAFDTFHPSKLALHIFCVAITYFGGMACDNTKP